MPKPLLIFSCLAALAVFRSGALAQGSAGSEAKFEPRRIVDMPTAGMLEKGSYAVDISFFQEGGLLAGFSVGALDRLMLGISYGGARLVGPDTPTMNELPGVIIKARLVNEGMIWPAVSVGFDTQGKDGYIKDLDRYVVKSPGFFAALSKNYSLLGFFSMHGGVNYSLERKDGDSDVNVYAGVEKSAGPFLSLVMEYNLGMNDGDGNAIGRGRGYLNGAINCAFGGGFTLGVNFKDFLHNAREATVANRTIQLEYIAFF